VIFGRGGADILRGGDGRDYLEGGRGDDRVAGEGGADTLFGGIGVDRLDGGPGPDALFSFDGSADVVDCGSGDDTAQVDRRDRVVNCETIVAPRSRKTRRR
jgi:Ca2+-binding RTX toxin-like protein